MKTFCILFFRAGPGGSLGLFLVEFNEIIYPDDKSPVPIITNYNHRIACECKQNVLHSIIISQYSRQGGSRGKISC